VALECGARSKNYQLSGRTARAGSEFFCAYEIQTGAATDGFWKTIAAGLSGTVLLATNMSRRNYVTSKHCGVGLNISSCSVILMSGMKTIWCNLLRDFLFAGLLRFEDGFPS
jgi:hypothetical protein